MKSFIEFQKPTHALLSQQIKGDEQITLPKASTLGKFRPQERKIFKKVKDANNDEILIGEIKATLAPARLPKKSQFAQTLNIWLQFWGRSALYFCVISFIVGVSLSAAYFYRIELNLDKLLTIYIACSFVLWFFLTPLALHRSLKKARIFIH
ncbi:MAG: hypothetical protein K2W94_03270 [Alphaproteobacteria bacterium]|nr:hypothetical protein [Alphaproteobacteria bacterium]